MNRGGGIIGDMDRLIGLFAGRCEDRSTLTELSMLLKDHHAWAKGHQLFQAIREKTLKAERSGAKLAETQYLFEEVCAKTLYNLSFNTAPFDPDSPYWILPNAIALARKLGMDEKEVLECVTV